MSPREPRVISRILSILGSYAVIPKNILRTGNKACIRLASVSFFFIQHPEANFGFCLKKKPACERWLFYFDRQVELAGIEPASKQGSLRLSTCLSYD